MGRRCVVCLTKSDVHWLFSLEHSVKLSSGFVSTTYIYLRFVEQTLKPIFNSGLISTNLEDPSRGAPLHKLTHFSAAILAALVAMTRAAMLMPGATFAGLPDTPAITKPSPLIGAMQTELERSFKVLGGQDPRAYFIGYTITETQRAEVSGSNGALLSSSEARNRWLQVSARTGTYTLDNTHKVGEQRMASGGPGTAVPVDNREQG